MSYVRLIVGIPFLDVNYGTLYLVNTEGKQLFEGSMEKAECSPIIIRQSCVRRAECNYVGLKNPGATCYMNSVIQQLYAGKKFGTFRMHFAL
jgi:ubiquitin C-terminal hydrolase